MQPRRTGRIAIALMLGLLISSVGLPPVQTDARSPAAPALAHDYPALLIHATDDGLTLPARVPAGRYLVTLQNASARDLDVLLLRPPAGITLAEVEENLVPDFGPLPAWLYDGLLPGGPGSTPAGGRSEAIVDLSVGPYGVAPVTDPDLAAPLDVVAATTASPIPSPPPATAAITLSEMAFGGLPMHLATGRGLWRITNTGQQPHQLTLIKAPAGITPIQVRTLLTLPPHGTPPPGIDLAAFAPDGGLGVLSPGQTAWAVLDLAPGTYVALCHVLDRATGTPDALLGMLAVFTVGGAATLPSSHDRDSASRAGTPVARATSVRPSHAARQHRGSAPRSPRSHRKAGPSMDRQDAIKTLREQIKDIKVAMLTTIEADGVLHARPMATQQSEFDGDLWFFTARTTATVRDVERDNRVNVSYASTDDKRWVSAFGLARVVDDKQKARDLWNPIYKAWFPKGLDDPDIVLLNVDVEHAEYWDAASGTMTQIVGFVKSLVTGQRFQPGENRQIDFPDV